MGAHLLVLRDKICTIASNWKPSGAKLAAELFAWAAPVALSSRQLRSHSANAVFNGDHTWVTSYDNRLVQHSDIAAVMSAGADYWYCWGNFYRKGGTVNFPDGLLGQIGANLAVANCLVTENLPSANNVGARGTVFQYFKDGVCHQLSNQVLYASCGGAAKPMTVRSAAGYWASTARWGTYGRQEGQFLHRFASCNSGVVDPSGVARSAMDGPEMAGLVDEFAERVHHVLDGTDPGLAERLLALRSHFQNEDRLASETESFEELNERGHRFQAAAQNLLGDRLFSRIFSLAPGQRVSFAHPAE